MENGEKKQMDHEESLTQDFSEGPFLQAALFCERLLEEKDNTKSAIRIVDRVNVTNIDPNAPGQMPKFRGNYTLFLAFKNGKAHGDYTISITPKPPSGKELATKAIRANFQGPENDGFNLIVEFTVEWEEEGLYWFEVRLNEKPVTKMPFEVVYLTPGKEGANKPTQDPTSAERKD